MAWTWLLTLAPVADDLINLVTSKVSNNKRRQELKTSINNKFKELFESSFKEASNDIKIIASWKNFVAPIHAINTVAISWDVMIDVAISEKNPEIAFKVITSDNIAKLAKNVSEISKNINKITIQNKISWRDSAVDIESQFENMIEDIKALSKITKKFEKDIKNKKKIDEDDLFHISNSLRNIRQKILTILNYWDAFLRDLVENLKKAPTTFVKGVPNLSDTAIKANYDEIKWKDIFEKTYEALKTDISSTDKET